MTRAPAIIVTVALAALLAGCGGDGQDPAADPSTTASPVGQAPPADLPVVTTGPPLAGPDAALRDRIYEVGPEMRPGTYTTTVPRDHGHPCYWARLRSFGQSGAVIDEGNPEPGTTVRVTVLAGDKGFKVANGCEWRPAA